MKASQAAYELIKQYEGFREHVYLDPVGIKTIGYGHTGKYVEEGTVTKERAQEILEEDVEVFEKALQRLVEVPLKQNQVDALLSFIYNVGVGAFLKSTMLKYLNSTQFEQAAREFPKWRFAKGKELEGLKRRRAAERLLFIG